MKPIIFSPAARPLSLAMRLASVFSWVALGLALAVIAGAIATNQSYKLSTTEWVAFSVLALVFAGAGAVMRLIYRRHRRAMDVGGLITLDGIGVHDHRTGEMIKWSEMTTVRVDHISKLFGVPTLLIAPQLAGLLANPKAKLVSRFESGSKAIKIPWATPLIPPPGFQTWVGDRLRDAGRDTVATKAKI